ncbi:unnamed protein product [Candidula unifasciata]|uniref:F-box domain-containing protein n=1 Tax=Candidula unifasciata TaxID=100452 RepID=A0A8S3ZXV1_9EUPU|nr:unnamed protein product [Candidula unifasciata]
METAAGPSSGAPIEKLPDDVLLKVFQHLPMVDRLRSMSVSRKWERVLSDGFLWRHVDLLEYRLDLRSMRKILRAYLSGSLHSLKIRGFADPGDVNSGRRPTLSDALLVLMSVRCPGLRVLHLYECRTSDFSFACLPASITCLEIVKSVWRPKWMKDKQRRLSRLQHLTLDKCVHVDDFEIEDVTYWRNLKYLSLRGCFRVGIDGIVTIAQYLLELECLFLCEIAVDDFAVDHIVWNLKKLKELCIAESLSITDRAVTTIAFGLPELKMLDISYSKYHWLIVERTASLSQEDKQILKNGFSENFVLIA